MRPLRAFAAESVNVNYGIFHLAGICAETDPQWLIEASESCLPTSANPSFRAQGHVDIHACWVEDARPTGNIQQRRHRAPKWLFGRGQPREAWVLYGAGSGHLHRKGGNANVHNIRHNAFVAALNS